MGVLEGLAEQSGSVFSIYTPLAPSPGMGGPHAPPSSASRAGLPHLLPEQAGA